jgi:hypothetical protein
MSLCNNLPEPQTKRAYTVTVIGTMFGALLNPRSIHPHMHKKPHRSDATTVSPAVRVALRENHCSYLPVKPFE